MENAVQRLVRVTVRVRGRIGVDWSDWFGGFAIEPLEGGETELTGVVSDQSELYGLLARLRDLGLPLVSVTSGEEKAGSGRENG